MKKSFQGQLLGIGAAGRCFFKNNGLKPAAAIIGGEDFEAKRSCAKPGLKAPGLTRQQPKKIKCGADTNSPLMYAEVADFYKEVFLKTVMIYSNRTKHQKLAQLKTAVESSNKLNIIYSFDLGKMNLKYCTGCWWCWWKTPGRCAIKDGIEQIHKSVIKSDLILYMAPLVMSTIPSELKLVIERMIPLLHPYFRFVDKEFHHVKRYKKYPQTSVILGDQEDTLHEDRLLNREYFDRLCKNFHSSVRYMDYSTAIKKEAIDELLVG